MHGHTGSATGAVFVAMWTVMMVAMMLPSFLPALARSARPLVLAVGYFVVWAALGAAIYAGGARLASAAARQPALAPWMPVAGALMVLVAAATQFTRWKVHHLTQLHAAAKHDCTRPASASAELRLGVRLGINCVCSCAGPTTVMLVLGVMDLRVMAIITAVVTAERLAPHGVAVARAAGVAAAGLGLVLLASAW